MFHCVTSAGLGVVAFVLIGLLVITIAPAAAIAPECKARMDQWCNEPTNNPSLSHNPSCGAKPQKFYALNSTGTYSDKQLSWPLINVRISHVVCLPNVAQGQHSPEQVAAPTGRGHTNCQRGVATGLSD